MLRKHRVPEVLFICATCFVALCCITLSAQTTVTAFPAGKEFPTIQEAIDEANPGDTIVVDDGSYRENLEVTKPLTILGIGGVTLLPEDRAIPAIRIAGAEGVLIRNVRVEAAATAIEVTQSTCRITGCWLGTTETGVQVVVLGSDRVSFEQCTFTGRGVGVLTVGDGTVEIVDCGFIGIGTGALLGGATSVLVAGCAFVECHEGISLSSSVKGTIVDNRIDDSRGSGILVGPAPSHVWDGPLVFVSNVIRNSMKWGISLCGISLSEELSFKGLLGGFGNTIEGEDGLGLACPADYEWPDGFFTSVDE